MTRLGNSLFYEDYSTGLADLTRISRLDFDVACLAHGRAMVGNAASRFRSKWGDGAPVTSH